MYFPKWTIDVTYHSRPSEPPLLRVKWCVWLKSSRQENYQGTQRMSKGNDHLKGKAIPGTIYADKKKGISLALIEGRWNLQWAFRVYSSQDEMCNIIPYSFNSVQTAVTSLTITRVAILCCRTFMLWNPTEYHQKLKTIGDYVFCSSVPEWTYNVHRICTNLKPYNKNLTYKYWNPSFILVVTESRKHLNFNCDLANRCIFYPASLHNQNAVNRLIIASYCLLTSLRYHGLQWQIQVVALWAWTLF